MTEERRLLRGEFHLLDYICFLKQAGPAPRRRCQSAPSQNGTMGTDCRPTCEFIKPYQTLPFAAHRSHFNIVIGGWGGWGDRKWACSLALHRKTLTKKRQKSTRQAMLLYLCFTTEDIRFQKKARSDPAGNCTLQDLGVNLKMWPLLLLQELPLLVERRTTSESWRRCVGDSPSDPGHTPQPASPPHACNL